MTKPKPKSTWKRNQAGLLGAESKTKPLCIRCGQPRGATVCWPYCPTCKS